jgi:ribosomal-protein-alanine N-acetyltransferase
MMETERLLIQNWELEDWLAFRPIATDPNVMRYITGGVPWPDDVIQAWVERQIDNARATGFCLWKLVDKTNGRLVGFCGLQFLGTTGEVEIGWWLASDCWGRGLATEAARQVLSCGFEAAGLKRIVAVARPENLASVNIMNKLGMQWEKDATSDELGMRYSGINLVFYSIERHT